MHVQQGAVLETLRRIQRFLDDFGDKLDGVNETPARKRLDESVIQMASHAVAQIAGRRSSQGETAKQRKLRVALRLNFMRPVSVIAAQKLREQPEFTLLRMPPWNVRGPRLTAAAHDMADAAGKYTDLFVQEGLPLDFVAQLHGAANQLDLSIDTRGQGQGQRVGATKGLKAETRRARDRIQVLDSLVRPKLGTDDKLLREWDFAIHIQRDRTPASAPPPGGTPSSTATATGATAAPTAAATGSTPSTPTPHSADPTAATA